MSDIISCAHILIKHCTVRNPRSWRDPDGDRITRTTIDQALKQLEIIRADLIANKLVFEQVAFLMSDCNSASNQGRLGHFQRGEMDPEFEQVAFSLKVGEISQPVITNSGVHLIKRDE